MPRGSQPAPVVIVTLVSPVQGMSPMYGMPMAQPQQMAVQYGAAASPQGWPANAGYGYGDQQPGMPGGQQPQQQGPPPPEYQ